MGQESVSCKRRVRFEVDVEARQVEFVLDLLMELSLVLGGGRAEVVEPVAAAGPAAGSAGPAAVEWTGFTVHPFPGGSLLEGPPVYGMNRAERRKANRRRVRESGRGEREWESVS